jgi:hypothetical protein
MDRNSDSLKIRHCLRIAASGNERFWYLLASSKGVAPFLSTVLASAPALNNASMISVHPQRSRLRLGRTAKRLWPLPRG